MYDEYNAHVGTGEEPGDRIKVELQPEGDVVLLCATTESPREHITSS